MERKLPSWHTPLLMLTALSFLGGNCGGGSGGGGGPPVVEVGNVDERCLSLAGSFPPSLISLPNSGSTEEGRAAVVQFSPQAVAALDLNTVPPSIISPNTIPSIPPDSDSDGVNDATKSQSEGFFPLSTIIGGATAVSDGLILVSASNYEEVIFIAPLTGEIVGMVVENPVSSSNHIATDYPFLPDEGTSALRTALSTRKCVIPPTPTDSLGDTIPLESRCHDTLPSYFTTYTAGTALAAGRLFVATSNLVDPGVSRFNPGTVLVYQFDPHGTSRPDIHTPVLFTTGFNPTAMATVENASGRELILAVSTGAIGANPGIGNVLTEGFVDVFDALSRRLVATIPLGLAGPASSALAVDPNGRYALLGASSNRQAYGIDLRALDDPNLYTDPGTVVVLDGSTLGFPDARIFTAASPLVLPDRDGGPTDNQCTGLTSVAVNYVGQRAFATDFCDGTLAVIEIDLVDLPPIPIPQDRFQAVRSENILAPLTADSLSMLRAPGDVMTRPGIPGVDYSGPDVFFLAGLPEGAVCGIRIDSF
jgi:hypothetical protein